MTTTTMYAHNHRGNCFDDAWSASGDGLRAKCDDHPEFARGACSDCPDCMACFDEAVQADEIVVFDDDDLDENDEQIEEWDDEFNLHVDEEDV